MIMDAAKARRNEALLAESTALLNDPEDVAEMKRVAEFLDSLTHPAVAGRRKT